MAGIKIVATFDAMFNSKMTCLGEDISVYESNLQLASSGIEREDSVAWGVSLFVVLAIASLGAVFAVYRKNTRAVLAREGQDDEDHENEESLDHVISRHWSKIKHAYSKLQQSVEES